MINTYTRFPNEHAFQNHYVWVTIILQLFLIFRIFDIFLKTKLNCCDLHIQLKDKKSHH